MRVQPQREKESGDNGIGDPPVPIPNTEVKPYSADDTKRATAWESRTLPDRGEERDLPRRMILNSSVGRASVTNTTRKMTD